MKTFIIVVADSCFDPLIGGSPIVRQNMSNLHCEMCDELLARNINPLIVRRQALVPELEPHAVEAPDPDRDESRNLFWVALKRQSISEVVGIWFDDALSSSVQQLIEAWSCLASFNPLPQLYGFIHGKQTRNGYAAADLSRWLTGQNLDDFTLLFSALSGGGLNKRECAPCFGRRATSNWWAHGYPATLTAPKDELWLNWVYALDKPSGYDRWLTLANACSLLLKDRDKKYDLADAPHRSRAKIFSALLPHDIKRPSEFTSDDHVTADLYSSEQIVPARGSVTVSFNTSDMADPTLLRLAEQGFQVLAPDTPYYRRNLKPTALYSLALLSGLQYGMPVAMAVDLAYNFYLKIAVAVQLDTSQLRPIALDAWFAGAAPVVDQILAELHYG